MKKIIIKIVLGYFVILIVYNLYLTYTIERAVTSQIKICGEAVYLIPGIKTAMYHSVTNRIYIDPEFIKKYDTKELESLVWHERGHRERRFQLYVVSLLNTSLEVGGKIEKQSFIMIPFLYGPQIITAAVVIPMSHYQEFKADEFCGQHGYGGTLIKVIKKIVSEQLPSNLLLQVALDPFHPPVDARKIALNVKGLLK